MARGNGHAPPWPGDFITDWLQLVDGVTSPDAFKKWAGVALVAGYALIGATWLIAKTDGSVAALGRRFANIGVECTKLPLEGFCNLLERLVALKSNVVNRETKVVHWIISRALSRLAVHDDAEQD